MKSVNRKNISDCRGETRQISKRAKFTFLVKYRSIKSHPIIYEITTTETTIYTSSIGILKLLNVKHTFFCNSNTSFKFSIVFSNVEITSLKEKKL